MVIHRPGRAVAWFAASILLAIGSFYLAQLLVPHQPRLVLSLPGPSTVLGFAADDHALLIATEIAPETMIYCGPAQLMESTIPLWPQHVNSVIAWDLRTGQRRYCLQGRWVPHLVQLSPEGRWLAGWDEQSRLTVWDARSGREVFSSRQLSSTESLFRSFSFGPDGNRLLLPRDSESTRVWRLPEGRPLEVIGAPIDRLTFSADGRRLATWQPKDDSITLQLWSYNDDRAAVLLAEHSLCARQVAVAPDLLSFATFSPGTEGETILAVWDMESGRTVDSLPVAGHWSSLRYSPTSDFLHLEQVSDTQIIQVRPRLRSCDSIPALPTVSPDRSMIAVPGRNGADLLAADDFGKRATLEIASDNGPRWGCLGRFSPPPVTSVTYSHDSQIVAIGRLTVDPLPAWVREYWPYGEPPKISTAVRLWDSQGGQLVHTLNHCRQVHFSPDGQCLVAELDGDIHVFDYPLRRPWWVTLATIGIWLGLFALTWQLARLVVPR